MLPMQRFGERFAGVAIAPLSLVSGVDESIGDAAHCGDNNGYRMLSRSVRNDFRRTSNACGISDRGTAELHYL